MTPPIVYVKDLQQRYAKKTKALQDVNLHIEEPELIGIIGNNGSGKSTLLKILAGRLAPTSGHCRVLDKEMPKQASRLRHKLSYISQDRALDPEMTGRETLRFFATLYKLPAQHSRQRLQQLIDTFELYAFLDRPVKSYSGGQAQRLHLAVGLLQNASIILLDEPTSALDQDGKAGLWRYIKNISEQGVTVLIISHDLEEIHTHCSRLWILNQGKLIADEKCVDLLNQHSLAKLHINCMTSLQGCDSLHKLVTQVAHVQSVDIENQQLHIDFTQLNTQQMADALASVLQIFQQLELPVLECRWRKAGLAAVYLSLTGQTLMAPAARPNPGRGGGRRKHRT